MVSYCTTIVSGMESTCWTGMKADQLGAVDKKKISQASGTWCGAVLKCLDRANSFGFDLNVLASVLVWVRGCLVCA